ncbi:MAG: (2Fe-2S)-binding protein [Myxococcota bacterium]
MIVCSCKGVSCRKIREVVREGATTVKAVRKACRAGSSCGMCRSQIAEIIAEEAPETCDDACAVVVIGGASAAA